MKALILCFHVNKLFCGFMDASRRLKTPRSEMKDSLLLSVARVLNFVLVPDSQGHQRGSDEICTHSGSYYKKKKKPLNLGNLSLLWPTSMPAHCSRWRHYLSFPRLIQTCSLLQRELVEQMVFIRPRVLPAQGWMGMMRQDAPLRPECGGSQALCCTFASVL